MKVAYSKAVYKLRGKRLDLFLKQEFTREKNKAEFISDTMQESPRKRELRSRLETSHRDSREPKRKLNSSFEEIKKLSTEVESYNENIGILARSEQQHGLLEKLLKERSMDKQLKDNYTRQLTEMQELYDENKEKLLENELEAKNKKIKSLSMTLSRRNDTKTKDKTLRKS